MLHVSHVARMSALVKCWKQKFSQTNARAARKKQTHESKKASCLCAACSQFSIKSITNHNNGAEARGWQNNWKQNQKIPSALMNRIDGRLGACFYAKLSCFVVEDWLKFGLFDMATGKKFICCRTTKHQWPGAVSVNDLSSPLAMILPTNCVTIDWLMQRVLFRSWAYAWSCIKWNVISGKAFWNKSCWNEQQKL